MNDQSPIVPVDVSQLARLPIHRDVTIKERDPKTKLYCEARIRRLSRRRATLRLRDWPGHLFDVEVDIVRAVAQLRTGSAPGLPEDVYLTACVFKTCMTLLDHREFD